MSKRQAEFQIHNQPMTEAENRAANMMNNQTPSKATPAQLAQRKIREAKGVARRRNPGTSPAPTAPFFSNTQSTSFFPVANPTTSTFGANGVNGVQQQTFAAPSSNTFSFSASTGTNPFAASGLSNPFSTQNSSNPFAQQPSTGAQQSTVFGQPAPSQPSSNLFSASSTFNFGQPSAVNNSFPPNQSTSIFSKSTPASNSFTFGSNPSSQQAPIFGAATQSSVADNDVAMEASESPFKNAAKSAASLTSSPSFGGSNPFSYKPTKPDASGDQKLNSSQPFGGLFQSKDSSVDRQSPTTATDIYQPTRPEKEPTQEPPSQPSAPIFNFFPKSAEPEKSSGQSSAQAFNPFASLKQVEKENTKGTQPTSTFFFGTSAGALQKDAQKDVQKDVQKDAQKEISEARVQNAAQFNPFQSLQAGGGVNAPSQLQEKKSHFSSLLPSQSNDTIRSNPFEFSETVDSQQILPSATPDIFQPSKATSTEKSQASPSFNPFQSLSSANASKSIEKSAHPPGASSGLFQTIKSSIDESNQFPRTQEKGDNPPQPDEASLSPLKQNVSASATSSTAKNANLAKDAETPFKQSNGFDQSKGSDVAEPEKARSETSNLFARTLEQSSAAAAKPAGLYKPSQSQNEQHTISPTKPSPASQQKINATSTSNAPPQSSTQPFIVKSHGASNIPQELNNDGFADFDKSYRLRSLNARFKRHIADLDPNLHDFEPVIRFYATQREAIGFPLGGLYHRVKAGEKRKTEEADRSEPEPKAAKRTKFDTTATPLQVQADHPVFDFSAITSLSTTPQPATQMDTLMPNSHNVNAVSITSQSPLSASKTSNVFKGLLSATKQPSLGTQGRLPSSSTPPSSTPAMSAFKPAGMEAKPFAPVASTASDYKSSTFHMDSQSDSSASSLPTTNGSHPTSQAFQPKLPATSTLNPPKFGSAGSTDFMAAFAAQAKKNVAKMEAENKAKRKAEEFDSDEDDEAEYERRAAEDDRAKRAKIEAIAKAGSGFTPVLSSASSANGASPAAEQDEGSTGNASHEGDELSENEDTESQEDPNQPEGDVDEEGGRSDDEESDNDDDIQTAMAKSHTKPKNPFHSSSDPKSLFNRITRPDAPLADKESKVDSTSPPAQNSSVFPAPPGTGLFGSRPSTPNHDSPNALGTSIFSNATSNTPSGDNTWKPGSAIKFGGPTFVPVVNITPATPQAKPNGNTTQSPFSTFSAAASSASKHDDGSNDDTAKAFSGVFGTSPSITQQTFAGTATATAKPFSTLFGDASKKTAVNQSSAAKVGFSFGAPGSSFLAPSNASSAVTSRATSPGLTDNDSAAESGTDDQANDPQRDYMSSRPGEEDEDVLFEVRTKVLEYMSDTELSAIGSKDEAGWKSRGLGPLRVLKNRETSRTRIVMRSEPGANVIINSALLPNNKYDVNPSGKDGASLKTGVYMDGKLKNWVFKVKTMDIANELVDCLLENAPEAEGKDDEESSDGHSG